MSKRKFSLYDSDDDDDDVEIPPEKIKLTQENGNVALTVLPTSQDSTTLKRPDDSKPGSQQATSSILANNRDYTMAAIAWRKGERDEMQDRHLVVDHLLDNSCDDIKASALFGLFDGHAGKLAAEFCEKNFAVKFKQNCMKVLAANKDLANLEKSMKKIFIDTYKNVDEDFLKEARAKKPTPLKDGTTATTLFLLNRVLYCANIGDSKAVVCRKKPENSYAPIQITADHHPMNFEERTRIQKAGGNVKDGRVLGILEVSRSIGDFQYKAHGVICTPDLKKLTLTSDDWFVILACDGLWKKFTSEEAINFAVNAYKKNWEEDSDDSIDRIWLKAADDLAAESVKRGCGDNVSVIIVVF